MPQVHPVQQRRSRRVLVGLALGVFVLLLGGAYAAYVYFFSTSDAKFDTVLRQTEILAGKREYAQEAKTLTELLNRSNSDKRKQIVIMRLAAAYANDKQYDKAIAEYQQAAADYPGVKAGATRGLAFLYLNRGEAAKNVEDLRKAQSYFEQALKLEKQDQAYQSYVQNDELNIEYVKGLIQDASK